MLVCFALTMNCWRGWANYVYGTEHKPDPDNLYARRLLRPSSLMLAAGVSFGLYAIYLWAVGRDPSMFRLCYNLSMAMIVFGFIFRHWENEAGG
jgi:hypothetical protein